jgi:hypothetical protein
MRDLGYREGQNLLVEARYADDRSDQLPGLAREPHGGHGREP